MSYVAAIRDSELIVCDADPALEAALDGVWTSRREGEELVIFLSDPAALPDVLTYLRDAGVAFAGAPHGWPPAEVFAELRDRCLVTGPFDEIVFVGPGRPQRRQR